MKRFKTYGGANKAFRQHKLIPVFILALLTSIFSTTVSAAELIVNGGFEEPVLSTFAKGSRAQDFGWTTFFGQNFSGTCTVECNGGTLIPGWSVVWADTLGGTNQPGRIEIQSNEILVQNPGLQPAKGGTQKAELDSHDRVGSSDNNVALFQEFQACPNTAYTLSYQWNSRTSIIDDNDVAVLVGGKTMRTHQMNTSWAEETIHFVTDNTGASSVAFVSIGTATTFGMSLDNVSVIGPALGACTTGCVDCTATPDAVGCNTCASSSSSASSAGAGTLGAYDSGWSILLGKSGGSTTTECGLCFVNGKKGKITQLTLFYDGDDFTSHAQPVPDKASVVPDNVTDLPLTANIKVIDEKNGTVLFEGSLGIGQAFSFAPKNELLITISDGSTLVQTIRFHASCSQPLEVNDTFGGITILSAITVVK